MKYFNRISRVVFYSFCLLLNLSLFVFAQNNFFIEAESVAAVSPWVLQNEKQGFSGTGYFYWNSGDAMGSQTGILTYNFTLTENATYIFEVHGRRDQEDLCEGQANDQCNDIWVNLANKGWAKKMVKLTAEDTKDQTKWGGRWGEWVWDPTWDHGPSMSIAAGTYTLKVAGRSMGVKIDAFRLYKSGDTPPEPQVSVLREQGMERIGCNFIEKAEVFTYSGKRIKTFKNISHEALKKELAGGLYLLKLNSKGKVFAAKLVVH